MKIDYSSWIFYLERFGSNPENMAEILISGKWDARVCGVAPTNLYRRIVHIRSSHAGFKGFEVGLGSDPLVGRTVEGTSFNYCLVLQLWSENDRNVRNLLVIDDDYECMCVKQ